MHENMQFPCAHCGNENCENATHIEPAVLVVIIYLEPLFMWDFLLVQELLKYTTATTAMSLDFFRPKLEPMVTFAESGH